VSPNQNANSKVFVITEAMSRSGLAAARTAAELDGEVILLDRRSNLAMDFLPKLKEEVPRGNFQCIECDLRDSESVRRAIKTIKSWYSKVYCLANGVDYTPTQGNGVADDSDAQGKSYVAHNVLTTELLPLLEVQANETGDARIMNHCSLGYHLASQHSKSYGNNVGDDVLVSVEDRIRPFFKSKLESAAFQCPTAFKNRSSRPGIPLMVMAQFICIRKDGSQSRCSTAKKSRPLVYTGIY